jgi:hypothetical protein
LHKLQGIKWQVDEMDVGGFKILSVHLSELQMLQSLSWFGLKAKCGILCVLGIVRK